jgi:exodeoxyribonuclease-3
VFYHGQKAHYGVAMLCKNPPLDVQYGFPTDDDEAQRRMIMVTMQDKDGLPVRILNGYFPQGENQTHETKYPAKRKFYQDLNIYLDENHNAQQNVIVMGDINISPLDIDIGIGEVNAKRWLQTKKCSFQPEEREWLAKLMSFGFIDTFRLLNPEVDDQYSWFDYRSRGFDDNRGLRIDVILATEALANKTIDAGIDYELRAIEKPSDHAPIWTEFA